ncbi:MAG: hypothetical protein HRT92_01835 [Piscirickettsiaceae bacterium]|nr:hypothetical protein [Piscirickettsiaceae bacterium]
MKVFSFRNVRIIVLLLILAASAIYTKEQRINTTSWYKPIEVTIFPINGDNTIETDDYIQQLTIKNFQDIDSFFARNAEQYQLITSQPIITALGATIHSLPPSPPARNGSILNIMIWSLKLRYWAYKNTPDNKSNTDRIRLYVLYHQRQDNQALEHSLGLQKGLIGIINVFADSRQNKQNTIIMTHEILHTVGASDKYDTNNQPVYPAGYAKPEQIPLHPQKLAELMAGRIALSPSQVEIPKSLKQVVVGDTTAREINWITLKP